MQTTAMADFNNNFKRISDETKQLQKDLASARSHTREENQRLEEVKTEISELTANKEVGANPSCVLSCAISVVATLLAATNAQLSHYWAYGKLAACSQGLHNPMVSLCQPCFEVSTAK